MKFTVVPYTPEHADEMRAVCLATASERARTEAAHAAFTLAMYCDPYLEFGTAFMLLGEDGRAHGYTMCCEDYAAWEPEFAPYAERIRALGPEYEARLADEVGYYHRVYDEYPAHLHIDIEEPYTGGGNGRALMETMIEHLRSAGVPAVSFGVAANNERAAGFYEHMGFTNIAGYGGEDEAGYIFAMRFDQATHD